MGSCGYVVRPNKGVEQALCPTHHVRCAAARQLLQDAQQHHRKQAVACSTICTVSLNTPVCMMVLVEEVVLPHVNERFTS
jgi:hypothetical protein